MAIPVVSIGGVDVSNAGQTVAAGCAGVAVVSAVFGAESPRDAARALSEAVEGALRAGRPPDGDQEKD